MSSVSCKVPEFAGFSGLGGNNTPKVATCHAGRVAIAREVARKARLVTRRDGSEVRWFGLDGGSETRVTDAARRTMVCQGRPKTIDVAGRS